MLVKKFFDLFRVKDWIYPCIGLMIFGLIDANTEIRLSLIWIFLSHVLYLCYLVVHNNMTDIDEDSVTKNYFKNLSYSKWKMNLITALLAIVVLFISWVNGFIEYAIIAVVVNGLYSNRPIRLKRFLLPSLLINIYLFLYIYLFTIKVQMGTLPPFEKMRLLPFIVVTYYMLQYILFLEHLEKESKVVRKIHTILITASFIPFYIYFFMKQQYHIGDVIILFLFQIGIHMSLYKADNYTVARNYARKIASLIGGLLVIQSIG